MSRRWRRPSEIQAVEKVVVPYWFQEETLDALERRVRFIAMCGGTGAGKTWWTPVWLAELIRRDHEAGNGDGARYLAIGPTSDMVNDMVLPSIHEHYEGTTLEGHYHRQERRYELPTGGNIYLRSADKPYRIEGHHVRGATLDEPSEMKALIWPIVLRRTALYQAPVLLTGYPTNMGWYYEKIFVPWKNGDEKIVVVQFSSTDNPEYPAEEFEYARKTLPDWLFEMSYLGKFRKPAGLVYSCFGPECYVDPFDVPDDWPSYQVLDPAIRYAGLFVTWHQGVYYVYDEYYETQAIPAEEHASILLGKCQGVNMGWIYDPARKTDAVNLMPHGCQPFYPAENDVSAGIISLTGLIKSGRFKVMRGRAPIFCDQMAKYRRPVDPATGQVTSDKPIKKEDDLPDCARYLSLTLEGADLPDQQEVVIHDEFAEISRY